MRGWILGALAIALVTVTLPVPGGGTTDWPTYDPMVWQGPPGPDVDPKIDDILRPLATVPTIAEQGSAFTVEVARDQDPALPVDDGPDLWLSPSFGAAEASVPLQVLSAQRTTSELWQDRQVTAYTVQAPQLDASQGVVEGLYDLHVDAGSQQDTQSRAVELVDAFPDQPRIVVIADPSVGDPRPVQEGAGDLQSEQDAAKLVEWSLVTAGVPTRDEGRWGALQKTVQEVNLLDPDLILVTGDLTFGVHPRALPYEYEDAYSIINKLQAPTFVTPGNHDLYTFEPVDGAQAEDGKDLWPRYFGPLYYSLDLPGDLHLVSLDTFDWSQADRIPFQPPDGETRSGGQVGEEQLAWLADDLTSFRAGHPAGHILTFAHHDPSWQEARHPWPGQNRLELRDLLNETGVAAHFAGHKHNDRVARYHEGDVVETIGQAGGPARQLHYIQREGDHVDTSWSQTALGDILSDPSHGTVFFTTTTAASGLKGPDWGQGGYWGYRYGTLAWQDGGLDPVTLGYPATEAFLERHAERPDRWNADHAAYGQFSYPSFFLNRTLEGPNDGTAASVTMHLSNDLATTEQLVARLSVDAGDADQVAVTGGDVVQARSDGEHTDVWVEVTLAPGQDATLTAEAPGGLP